eukprot:383344-Prymnesium_polylepis.1
MGPDLDPRDVKHVTAAYNRVSKFRALRALYWYSVRITELRIGISTDSGYASQLRRTGLHVRAPHRERHTWRLILAGERRRPLTRVMPRAPALAVRWLQRWLPTQPEESLD